MGDTYDGLTYQSEFNEKDFEEKGEVNSRSVSNLYKPIYTGKTDENGFPIFKLDYANSEESIPTNVNMVDSSGRNALNSIFGEVITGTRKPTLAAQFMYGVDARAINSLSVNGGSVTTNNSMLEVSSGTNTNGDGLIESKQSLRYLAGHEAYLVFTTVFSQGVTNNNQQVGLYEENNGFYIGFKGETFGFTRLRDGTETFVSIDNFDTDIQTGNNAFGFQLDPTKGNVWRISYGYLGFAPITLEVLCECGRWLKVHRIKYPNTEIETHIANTYLPLRARSINNGNTTDITIKIGSVSAGIVNGGALDVTSRAFSDSTEETATANGGTAIATHRNKSTFNGRSNYIPALLERIALSTDGAQNVTVQLRKNMTFTNTPTYTDIDTQNSTLEVSTDATATAGTGELLIAFELAKAEDYIEAVKEYDLLLYPNEVATFFVLGNNNVRQSINWTEQF